MRRRLQVLPALITVVTAGGALCFPTAVTTPTPAATKAARATGMQADDPANAASAVKRIAALGRANRDLTALAAEPTPPGLTAEQVKALEEYNRWLASAGARLKALADRWQHALGAIHETPGTTQMQEMNQSFNLQYLTLQNKISQENRQFSMVSNIMKNKHDTAKNSINNIR